MNLESPQIHHQTQLNGLIFQPQKNKLNKTMFFLKQSSYSLFGEIEIFLIDSEKMKKSKRC